MIREIIIGNILNWFQQRIGKHIFPNLRLRHKYKQELNDIVDYFDDAMHSQRKTCSLYTIINNINSTDTLKRTQIKCQAKNALILEKWYSSLKSKLNSTNLKQITQYYDEFARILYQTHDIFREFSQTIQDEEEIIKRLRKNDAGYPLFEKIYNETTKDFEKITKQASYKLKKEYRDYKFSALPKL